MPIKLCYYSKSKDVEPGKGVHECVPQPDKFKELNKIKNWRQILSNFYKEQFIFEDRTYNSVEHAFQSYKIRTVDPIKAEYFTVESGHTIGSGDGSIAQKNRKLVKLNNEQLIYWDSIKHDVMKKITKERITQSKIYKDILLKTLDAELWHVQIRKSPIRNIYLEELRDEFY